MPDQIRIHAYITHIDCPNCSAPVEGFVSDPRGSTYKCDECGKDFVVPEDAEVDLG